LTIQPTTCPSVVVPRGPQVGLLRIARPLGFIVRIIVDKAHVQLRPPSMSILKLGDSLGPFRDRDTSGVIVETRLLHELY